MRRCMLLVFVLLLLLSLTACGQKMTVTFDQAVTDCQGLQVTAEYAWEEQNDTSEPAEEKQLKLVLRMQNDTEQFVLFGSRFVVEREENGQWVPCQMHNIVWSDVAYFLEPGKSREDAYYLNGCYAIEEPGKYRFQMGVNLSENTDMKDLNPDGDYKVTVEFTVK